MSYTTCSDCGGLDDHRSDCVERSALNAQRALAAQKELQSLRARCERLEGALGNMGFYDADCAECARNLTARKSVLSYKDAKP